MPVNLQDQPRAGDVLILTTGETELVVSCPEPGVAGTIRSYSVVASFDPAAPESDGWPPANVTEVRRP